MSEAYLGETASPHVRRISPVDVIGLAAPRPAPPEPQVRAPPSSAAAVAPAWDWLLLLLVGLAIAWGGIQLMRAGRASAPSLEPPAVDPLQELPVNAASLADAKGEMPTWSAVFDRYGLDQSIRERTLDDPANWTGGRRPDPDAPIQAKVVTVVLGR
jgi:hypothetical protein